MADTVQITAGSGVTIATDQVTLNGTPQQVQYVKILSGADGGTGRLSVTTGGTLTITAIQGTAASLNAQVVGSVAHDDAASGNPVRIGLKARSTLLGVTAVASHDVTDAYGDLDGVMLARGPVPLGNLTFEVVSATTSASTAFTTFNATTLLRNYITTAVFVNKSGSTFITCDLRDGTGGSILCTVGMPLRTSTVIPFNPPLRQPTTNTALAYDSSVALGAGYVITLHGFKSKL
jgi:hypothetical protein